MKKYPTIFILFLLLYSPFSRAEHAINAQLEPREHWSGQAGVAVSFRESNRQRRVDEQLEETDERYESYRIYGNLGWEAGRNNLDWIWNYRYSRNDVRMVDDFLNLSQHYRHNFTGPLFASARTRYEQDFRRGIEEEYLQTAELGISWFEKNTNVTFTTSLGGGFHWYERMNAERPNADGKFILNESLRWNLISTLTLFQKYTHLGSWKDYHLMFVGGLENRIIQDLFLRLECRLDRDTNIRYDDNAYYDRSMLTSLLYKF